MVPRGWLVIVGVLAGTAGAVLAATRDTVGAAVATPASAPATGPNARKILFNSLIYSGMPKTIGDDLLVNNSVVVASEKEVRAWARGMARQGVGYIALDIEDQHTDIRRYSPAEVAQATAYLLDRVHWVRQEAPAIKVGIYNYPMGEFYAVGLHEVGAAARRGENVPGPHAAYWAGPGWEDAKKAFAEYQRANDALQPLYKELDFSAPELYTHEDMRPPGSLDMFLRFARGVVAECRRLQPEKPVYPYVMPCYTPDVPGLAMQDLDTETFRQQMRVIWKEADGVILWGGWKQKGQEPWDEKASWWPVIRDKLYEQ